MIPDRDLLELAAKACGYDTSHPWNAERLELTPPVNALWIRGGSTGWDPLTDDGDSRRLQVKLGIAMTAYPGELAVHVSHPKTGATWVKADDALNYDMDAAARRAVLLVAAAIGEAMP